MNTMMRLNTALNLAKMKKTKRKRKRTRRKKRKIRILIWNSETMAVSEMILTR